MPRERSETGRAAPWDGDPDARFGAHVSLLNRSAGIYFTRHLAPHGIGPGQQAYLLALAPGESLWQGEIASRLSMDKANVARAVQSLCASGHLTRGRPPDDRRKWVVRLTAKGERVRAAIERAMIEWVRALKVDLADVEWIRFCAALERIARRAMEAASGSR